MSYHDPNVYGAAAIGTTDSVDPQSLRIIDLVRRWGGGPDRRQEVWNALAVELGPARARRALKSLEEFLDLIQSHGRRPLVRHGVGCRCIGSDETIIAHFVRIATEGEREDAMLVGTLLVRPDIAPIAASLAQQLGLALLSGVPAPRGCTERMH